MQIKHLRYFLRPLCWMLLWVAATNSVALADTIRLKSGQTLTGKIVSYSDRKFTIVFENSSAETRAIISLEDIDTVEFDGRPLPAGFRSGTGDGHTRTDITYPPPIRSDSDSGLPARTEPGSGDGVPTTRPGTETPPVRTEPAGGAPTTVPAVTYGREISVTVVAREPWTFAQVMVQKGEHVRISADGTVRLNGRLESTPDGIEAEDPDRLLLDRPTGSLIAVIGDDNDDFIFIGKGREFTATRSGKLFLSINEGDLSDNTGSFSARVQIGH